MRRLTRERRRRRRANAARREWRWFQSTGHPFLASSRIGVFRWAKADFSDDGSLFGSRVVVEVSL